jgi:hypothetical protein
MKAPVIIVILVLLGIASFSLLELRASNTLLAKCALLRPGMNLSTVTSQLGQMMYEKTNLEEIVAFGSIKDASFCRGKKLFWFYASTPPCRALEVYTDTNNIVVYVTWRGL